jgi:type IV fimbrial biogenesis protein FimT
MANAAFTADRYPVQPPVAAGGAVCAPRPRGRRDRGFTLVELLIAVAVLTIVLLVGVPTFGNLIDETHLTTTTNQVVASMHLARSEAIKRGVPVGVCASTDGISCSGSKDWAGGWMVFTNRGRSLPPAPGANDDIIHVGQAVSERIVLNASHPYVQYSPMGHSESF